MQESVRPPVVMGRPIGQGSVVVAVAVNPIGDSLDGAGPGECRDVLGGHMGGPRLRSQFGRTSIYGDK